MTFQLFPSSVTRFNPQTNIFDSAFPEMAMPNLVELNATSWTGMSTLSAYPTLGLNRFLDSPPWMNFSEVVPVHSILEELLRIENIKTQIIPVPRKFFEDLRQHLLDCRGTDEDWDTEERLVEKMDAMEREWNEKIKLAVEGGNKLLENKSLTRAEILAPLHEIFLSDQVMDQAIISTGIPELMDGQESKNNGCILNGPPGTGKTVLLRAVAKVYQNCGAFTVEISEAGISERYVGSKANNLDGIIQNALTEARKRGRPSFLYLDEASSSVSKSSQSGNTTYYQEALDVLKKYIGNYPELVFAISTNAQNSTIDDALIREGRLQIITVKQPEIAEKIKMWRHFLKKYGVISELSNEQYEQLARTFPKASQGAAIELFARTFMDRLALEERKIRNRSNLLRALETQENITGNDIKINVTYDMILEKLKSVSQSGEQLKETKPRRFIGYSRPENKNLK